MNQSAPLLPKSSQYRIQGVFDNAGNIYVNCPTHQTYYITSMCLQPSCNEPLCQECVSNHIENHQRRSHPTIIQNIQNVRYGQKEKIESYLRFLIELQQTNFSKTQLEINMEKLKQAKQQIIEIVDQIFRQYEGELKYRMEQLGYSEDQQQNIQKEIIKAKNILADFDSEDYLSAIKYTIERKFGEKQEFLQRNKPINEDMIPEILVNNNYKDDIYESIQNYITITKYLPKKKVKFMVEEKEFETEDSIMHLSNKPYLNEIETNTQPIQPKLNFFNDIQELQKTSTLLYDNLLINDQQQMKPLLFSAKDNSNILIFYDLQQLPMKKEEIQFNITFPSRHLLIVLNQEIYLIGGLSQDEKVAAQVYTLDLKNKKAIWNSNMVQNRCDFGACCVSDKYIYVCGGTSNIKDSRKLQSLERFDKNLKRWVLLAPSQIPSIGLTLVNISNRFLAKIGGIDELYYDILRIEVYNIKRNVWYFMKIFESNGNIWNQLGARQGCAQINETQLLIFGGDIGERQVDDCWVITMDIKDEIDSSIAQRWYSLPVSGDVWSQSIIANHRVYTLIRSQTLEYEKKVMVECKCDSWSQLR